MNTHYANAQKQLIEAGFVIEKDNHMWYIKLGDECVSVSKSLGDALHEASKSLID